MDRVCDVKLKKASVANHYDLMEWVGRAQASAQSESTHKKCLKVWDWKTNKKNQKIFHSWIQIWKFNTLTCSVHFTTILYHEIT
jgi:hypothetical protein